MKKTLLLSAILLCSVWLTYGQWTYTNLSEPKSFMGSTTLGSKAWFGGGYNGTNFLTAVEIYDINTGSWESAGDLSVPREFVGGVISCGSLIFFAGGWNYVQSLNTVDIYDTATGEWAVEHLSVPRFSMAAISYNNKVMFAGGFIYPGQTRTKVVDIYDISNGEWTTDSLTIAREGIAAAVVGDLAIFAGGMTNSGSTNRVDIYNFTDNTWSATSLSQARGMANATTVGDKVIIAGGVTSNGHPTDRVDIYDGTTGTWSASTISFARAAQTNDATINGKAFFAGGGIFIGNGYNSPSDIIDIYDAASETWSTNHLPQALIDHSVVEINDYLIVAGGEDKDGEFVSQVAIYRDPTLIHVPGDYLTIQEAINAASDGDTVLVADGLYYENINFLGRKPLMVASHFLLDGDTNHIANTIIDGSHFSDIDNASVVAFKSGEDTTSILCGFTIQGGRGTWDSDLNNRCGGGIYISGSGAKILHNKITANTVDDTQVGNGQETYGGGIGTSHEDADYWIVIEQNQIYNNSAVTHYGWAAGGGIYNSYNARIADNIIFDNTSLATTDGWGSGGGFSHVDVDGGNANILIILNNKFHHNTAQSISGYGVDGAATTVNAQLIFTGNEITANTGITALNGGGGGGISVIDPAEGCIVAGNIFRENLGTFEGGAITLENYSGSPDPKLVLITDNYFLDNEGPNGGAVKITDIPIIFQNNVFHGNKASLRGGAIFMQKSTSYPFIHLVTLINNSFYANSALNSGGAIYSIKANPLIFNSVFFNDIANTSGPEIYSNYPSDTVIIAFCNIDMSLIYGNGYVNDAGGNINENPGFLDDSCHIDEFSPCVDKGADSVNFGGTWYYAPLTDLEGTPRPWSNGIDIGADECDIFGNIPNPFVSADPFIQIHVSPNPFGDHTNISYDLVSDTKVEISLFNSQGELVRVLLSGIQAKGSHVLEFDSEGLPAGIYFCVLKLNSMNQKVVGRLVKIK